MNMNIFIVINQDVYCIGYHTVDFEKRGDLFFTLEFKKLL